MGEANAKWLSFTFEGVGNTIDAFSNMSEPVRQAATGLGALAAGASLTLGSIKLLSTFFGGNGALRGSALALDGSAAALTRAAVALGGAGAMDGMGGPGGNGKGWKNKLGKLGTAGSLGIMALEFGDDIPHPAVLDKTPAEAAHDTYSWLKKKWEDAPSIGFGATAGGGGRFGQYSVNGTVLDQTKTKADAAGEAVDALNKTVTPNVNTTSIDEALRKLSELSGALGSVNSAASRTSSALDQRLRGIHADVGISAIGHQ
jgi:hypothetical protein